jgi:hypothetical protein
MDATADGGGAEPAHPAEPIRKAPIRKATVVRSVLIEAATLLDEPSRSR